MTADEIIVQIETLPPSERDKVLDFIRALPVATGATGAQVDDKAFNEAADWVFREHADLMRKLSQ